MDKLNLTVASVVPLIQKQEIREGKQKKLNEKLQRNDKSNKH